jgi:hypothetical protein
MALQFYLSLETANTPEELFNLILQKSDIDGINRNDTGEFYATGVVGSVSFDSKNWKEMILDDFGITSNVSVWCWHRNSEYKEGLRNILKAYICILKHTTGDAVLRHDSGYINLIRKNGIIQLDSEAFFEDEEAMWRFKDVPFEYEVKDMNVN